MPRTQHPPQECLPSPPGMSPPLFGAFFLPLEGVAPLQPAHPATPLLGKEMFVPADKTICKCLQHIVATCWASTQGGLKKGLHGF